MRRLSPILAVAATDDWDESITRWGRNYDEKSVEFFAIGADWYMMTGEVIFRSSKRCTATCDGRKIGWA